MAERGTPLRQKEQALKVNLKASAQQVDRSFLAGNREFGFLAKKTGLNHGLHPLYEGPENKRYGEKEFSKKSELPPDERADYIRGSHCSLQ